MPFWKRDNLYFQENSCHRGWVHSMILQLSEPTLDRLLDHATTQFASKDALIYNDVTITYDDLRVHVDNLAKGLIKLGVKKGDKVKEGDIVAVLNVMKTEINVASHENGKVKEILVKEWDEMDAGTPMIALE